jgi:hypothetical protein
LIGGAKLSDQDRNQPEERLKELEFEFKLDNHHRRRKSEIIEEAAELCLEHEINYPPWVDFWHLHRDPFQEHATALEKAFKAGNLGALKEIVYWCKAYREPLPDWAVHNIYKLIDALATDKKSKFDKDYGLGRWRAWFRQYRQNMEDYEIYDTIKEARGEYLESGDDRKPVEWCDIYEVAGAIAANQHPKDSKINENTIKETYDRAGKRLKENPLQYKILHSFAHLIRKPREKLTYNHKLWQWINDTIKAGNPKKSRKRK